MIEGLLEQSLGIGHVTAQVSADINFDRIVTNSELYDPDGQVVRSTQSDSEIESSEENNKNDNVSVVNNLPNAPDNNADGAKNKSSSEKISETTNYEISKTIRNHISETGNIKKLSIAVLIDGIYTTNKETGIVTYTPRSQEELDKIEVLVKSAVGLDDLRGDTMEIVNMQFQTDLESLREPTLVDWFKQEFAKIIQTLVIALVIILVILLVVRPIAIRAFEMTKEEMDELTAIDQEELENYANLHMDEDDSDDLLDIDRIDKKLKSDSVRSINEIVKGHPEETVAIIRKWFNEDSSKLGGQS